MRMLDNKSITPEQVDEIKDDVEYYVSDCNEPGFTRPRHIRRS